MKKQLSLLVFIVSILLIGACQKDDGGSSTPATDTFPSVITVDFPTAGTVYINGANINITGTITDNNNLSTAKVEIKNKTTNAILNQQTSGTGTVTFYRFNWNWTVSGISSPTPGTVKITAKDKNGFEVTKEVDITLDN